MEYVAQETLIKDKNLLERTASNIAPLKAITLTQPTYL